MSEQIRPMFSDILKSVPGIFGIRLEEEPTYDVLEQLGDVEIRRYQEALLARVTVSGDHDTALDEAFTRLAGYIYGKNSLDEKMAMTSPVFQEESATGDERMPMATPLAQSAAGDGWTVSFFLSNDLKVEDAPTPDDTSIELLTEPGTVRACLRYTGNNTAERRTDAKARLLDVLSDSPRWRLVEDVSWAQYDQPFAIPFLKRNEAHVALEEKIRG